MSAQTSEQVAAPHIDRRDLRGYNRAIQDVLIRLINERGVRYRQEQNKVLLYAPDGSPPHAVWCRSTANVKPLLKWAERHVGPAEDDKPAKTETLETLAHVLNSEEAEQRAAKPRKPKPEPDVDHRLETAGESYQMTNGRFLHHIRFITEDDGSEGYYCVMCKEWLRSRRSVGQHQRIHEETDPIKPDLAIVTHAAEPVVDEPAETPAPEQPVVEQTQTQPEPADAPDDNLAIPNSIALSLSQIIALASAALGLDDITTVIQQRDDALRRATEAEARLSLIQDAFRA